MSSNWKPQGSSTISVYLVAEGAQRVIDFLKKTFDVANLEIRTCCVLRSVRRFGAYSRQSQAIDRDHVGR